MSVSLTESNLIESGNISSSLDLTPSIESDFCSPLSRSELHPVDASQPKNTIILINLYVIFYPLGWCSV